MNPYFLSVMFNAREALKMEATILNCVKIESRPGSAGEKTHLPSALIKSFGPRIVKDGRLFFSRD